jgi:methylmalonyl-CoA/ethylmalonyl-CoA epimerase
MSGLMFDHVREIEAGQEFLRAGPGIREWTEVFVDEGIGVYVQFGRGKDGPCYELIAPLGEASPVAGALRGGKHILNM